MQGEETAMRIDLNAIIPNAPDPGQSTKSGSRTASSASSSEGPAGADTAKLSQDLGRVQELASQVSQLPEIRQDKVEALQRAIEEGSYRVTPGQAAEALISAIQIRRAA
jgi:flagellar biosynthesis anti-sigma factor FlgM